MCFEYILFRYIRDNATATDKFGRSYVTDVPEFLKNRPPSFIKHCMSKMELADTISANEVLSLGNRTYKVTPVNPYSQKCALQCKLYVDIQACCLLLKLEAEIINYVWL